MVWPFRRKGSKQQRRARGAADSCWPAILCADFCVCPSPPSEQASADTPDAQKSASSSARTCTSEQPTEFAFGGCALLPGSAPFKHS